MYHMKRDLGTRYHTKRLMCDEADQSLAQHELWNIPWTNQSMELSCYTEVTKQEGSIKAWGCGEEGGICQGERSRMSIPWILSV